MVLEGQVYTVDQVSQILKIARSTVFQAIRKGDIPAIRVSRRVLIPKAALDRMLQNGNKPVEIREG